MLSNIKTFGIYNKVPLNIFQVGINKNEISNDLKIINPEFNYFYFDEKDCEIFIYNNYPETVYKAFLALKPIEYKFNLWKYCILYKYGGIYIHNKYECNIKLINLIDNNFFVSDRNYYYNKLLINTDFIVSISNNPIFKMAIDEIINNVNINYYGIDYTFPTGSGLLGKIFSLNRFKTLLYINDNKILFNKIIILKIKKNYKNNNYCNLLWLTKNIYNKNL
jgi:hypothetical protein